MHEFDKDYDEDNIVSAGNQNIRNTHSASLPPSTNSSVDDDLIKTTTAPPSKRLIDTVHRDDIQPGKKPEVEEANPPKKK